MKTLKITTHWTPEQADTIYQFLYELKDVLWQHYGEDILQMHKTINEQQMFNKEQGTLDDLDDEIPF